MKKNWILIAIGVILALFSVNWISVKLFAYPVVYCTAYGPVNLLFGPWYYGVWLIALGYFIFQLFRYGVERALGAGAIIFVLVAAPQWMDILWRLGQSCT